MNECAGITGKPKQFNNTGNEMIYKRDSRHHRRQARRGNHGAERKGVVRSHGGSRAENSWVHDGDVGHGHPRDHASSDLAKLV